MNRGLAMVGGLGLGAGAMYFLDPDLGRRRRAQLRDRALGTASRINDFLDAGWQDMRQRAQGLVAQTAHLVRSEHIPDHILLERVRSKMGRYVSHPASIDVAVHDGRVILRGPVLAREVDPFLARVRALPGVKDVDNRLEVRPQAGDEPGLQGGRGRSGERPNLLETNWAPATRLLAGAAGGALLGYGFTRRFPVACVLGTAGLALLARAATNTELRRLLGLGCGRRA